MSAKKETTRGRSDRQEKFTAKTYGGRRTKNSGAMDEKADVIVKDTFRFEDKTTKHASFTLKLKDLQRLEKQAKGDEMPVFKIAFEDDLRKQYCVIPEHWFQFLVEEFSNGETD